MRFVLLLGICLSTVLAGSAEELNFYVAPGG